MKYYVYVLRSLRSNKRYVGYSSKNPETRLKEHNNGTNKWTRTNKPFILIYQEEYSTKTEARKREVFLKSGQGRKWLDEKLN